MSPLSLFMCDSALSQGEPSWDNIRPTLITRWVTRLGQAGVDTHRYSNYALTIPHTLISVLLLAITTRFFSEKKRQVFGNNFNFARCVN